MQSILGWAWASSRIPHGLWWVIVGSQLCVVVQCSVRKLSAYIGYVVSSSSQENCVVLKTAPLQACIMFKESTSIYETTYGGYYIYIYIYIWKIHCSTSVELAQAHPNYLVTPSIISNNTCLVTPVETKTKYTLLECALYSFCIQ